MRRLVAALRVVTAILAVGLTLVGPAARVVLAHAQLVSSTPGSGSVVAVAPTEARLVFSEPLDPAYSSADVLDQNGATLVAHAGRPDPADAGILVVPLPALADGAYTINWRSLSATDGHQASGFISFGVGVVDPAAVTASGAGPIGNLHDGHDGGIALLGVQARTAADIGFMISFGLLALAFGVLRPTIGWRRGTARAQAWSLAIAAIGGITLGIVTGASPGLDPAGYLASTRPGQLLLVRSAIGLVGAAVVWLLAARGRLRAAVIAGGAAGAAGLVGVALGGHAGAFDSPAPTVAMLTHLAAAGVWTAGLATLVALVITERDRAWVAPIVTRFSALALVAIGLVAATGMYSAWVETADLVSLGTPYHVNLWIKVGLVAAALAIGAANYLGGGGPRSVHLGRQVALEGLLAVLVVAAAANLASGSPPGREAPTQLTPSAAASGAGITLGLSPARPGPNRLVASWDGSGPQVAALELRLDRLDTTIGESIIPFSADAVAPDQFAADGIVLPPNSRWDATVVLRDHAGTEVGRRRFTFAMSAVALAAASPPIVDLGAVLALLLGLGGLLAAAVAIAGGSLPRTEPGAGRQALVVAALVALPLGIVIVVWRVVP